MKRDRFGGGSVMVFGGNGNSLGVACGNSLRLINKIQVQQGASLSWLMPCIKEIYLCKFILIYDVVKNR